MTEENTPSYSNPPPMIRRGRPRTIKAKVLVNGHEETVIGEVKPKEEFFFTEEIKRLDQKIDAVHNLIKEYEKSISVMEEQDKDLENIYEVVQKQEEALVELQEIVKKLAQRFQ